MRLHVVIVLLFSALLFTGCVAPMQHTYFVPNPEDGKPVRSSSCGFVDNNKEALERTFGELSVVVTPLYFGNGKLSLNFFLRHPSPVIFFDAKKVTVRESKKGVVLEPIDMRISSYGPDRSHPYTLSITLSFSATSSEIDALVVSLGEGALIVDGHEIALAPFRFKQSTTTDLYYASINC